MKAISLWQPWASLVACGAKRFETRSWQTHHRGPLAIHAAKKLLSDAELERDPCRDPAFLHFLHETLGLLGGVPDDLPRGAIIAVAELVGCRPAEEILPAISDQELAFGDYRPGRFAWELADVRALALPVPYRGAQGLFDVPDD